MKQPTTAQLAQFGTATIVAAIIAIWTQTSDDRVPAMLVISFIVFVISGITAFVWKGTRRWILLISITALLTLIGLIIIFFIKNFIILSQPIIKSINAHPLYSGNLYSTSQDFTNFDSETYPIIVGDIPFEEIISESRVLLTFPLDEIPYDARVQSSSLLITCRNQGDSTEFGMIHVAYIGFPGFVQDFDAAESLTPYNRGWPDSQLLLHECNENGGFRVSGDATLNEIVQARLLSDPKLIQFIFYYDDIQLDEYLDGMVFFSLPTLNIEYVEQ